MTIQDQIKNTLKRKCRARFTGRQRGAFHAEFICSGITISEDFTRKKDAEIWLLIQAKLCNPTKASLFCR